jgi:negative regulator of sigma E activity
MLVSAWNMKSVDVAAAAAAAAVVVVVVVEVEGAHFQENQQKACMGTAMDDGNSGAIG